MSKIWEGTCQSFKKHPSGGEAVYVVFVKEKFKKDAVEAAKKELGFWDPDNSGDYQAPRMVEVKEGGEEKLSAYLASKETEGQEEISEGDEFVEELATKSEFPLQPPYALWVAVVSAGERYSSSIQLVDRSNGNKTEFGDIDSFLPYTFSSVGNAVSYALLTAVDSLNAGEIECASVMVNALLEFADDPESNFIDHYVSEMDLSDAYIMEPEEFYEEPLVIDSFDTEHPELQEAVAMCVARYRGADKADAKECYSKLVEVLRPDFEMYPLCAAVMKLKKPSRLNKQLYSSEFRREIQPRT
ncbi:hypothetical protein [Vibrio harveyi]|uniref:hypothetical protein n=1 Tax=Vibrio harveyi TaxID=669 RepID=UPI00217D4370|nr:hypothetical protein [Vibrio harveyi]